MPRPTKEQDRKQFVEMLRKLGGAAGNSTLRNELGWQDDRYWRTHEALFTDDRISRGRGKGGSVTLYERNVNGSDPTPQIPLGERALYVPARKEIEKRWAPSKYYEEDSFVVEITAQQGKRNTGGKWSRPDVTMIAVREYDFIPGKHLDVATFEIKPAEAVGVEGVFEALSHRQASTYAYAIFVADNETFNEHREVERILAYSKAHGIGLIIAEDIGNFDTWDERLEPVRGVPDPKLIQQFIQTSMSSKAQEKIRQWVR
jgi:hypothetical protein